MNRFKKKKLHIKLSFKNLSIILFLLVMILFFYGVINLGSSTVARQETALQNAIEKDIINCYALEGFYPPSLTYMKEHYGLHYNEDLFFVDYQPVGSNLFPNVTIIRKGAASYETKN